MFLIYNHQIAQLDVHFRNQLVGQISEHLREHFPDDYARLGDGGRDTFIRDGIRAGQAHGLTTDRNLTLFVDFRLTFGPDFPAGEDWATAILDDEDLTEDEKMDRLLAAFDEDE